MGLKDDLTGEVSQIFREAWTSRKGQVVPSPDKLRLGNDRVELDATVLYADMARSTHLVDNYSPEFAAEIYKAFLTCSARIIKKRNGVITAYDGDRIMAVYIGDYKRTNAVKTALNINYAMVEIIRPALKVQYPSKDFVPSHGVGIDSSTINVSRVGVRNDNDLVWIGRAGNHAAKLSDLRDGSYRSWFSDSVYDRMADEGKISGDGRNMWEKRCWKAMGNRRIYRSSWKWSF